MAQWSAAPNGRKCSVHDPEVMGSNPGQVETEDGFFF